MISDTIVRFVIGSNTLVAGLKTWGISVKVCQHTTTTSHIGCSTIVFATAAVGAVGCDPRGLVDASATVLVLVAMLSSLAGAGVPFKPKLIFSDFHSQNKKRLVGPLGLEPRTNGL